MFTNWKAGCVGLIATAVFGFGNDASATVVITTTTNATTLVNSILGVGITTSALTYIGASNQSGTFTGGLSAGIGIDTGIILTSGDATLAPGPNISDASTGANSLAGDADLTTLSGFNTNDAAVLEFDFQSTGGDLFFNYVFASEEYNEFTNSSFNDVFAFFVDGVNIALIPGTSTAVAINTVNGGNPLGTNATHPEFYNNNDLNDGGPFFDIEYDGFTDVFTASVLGLSAGSHHIKIAIADASDSVLDSAVFIQGGSFSDAPTPVMPVPEPNTLAVFGLGLVGLAFMRRRRKLH